MKDGFIKVAACTPEIRVADTAFNAEKIIEQMDKCRAAGVKIAVFPELCITGYTCQDLFYQDTLLDGAMRALANIAKHTAGSDMLVAVGCPVRAKGKLYNCAAVLQNGEVLRFIPKTHLPNYNEFYEARHFAPYCGGSVQVELTQYFSDDIMHSAEMGQCVFELDNWETQGSQPADCVKIGFEICEDLWVADPVSNYLAKAGAALICNLSASDEVIGKDSYRRQLVSNQSARLVAGYIYCSAGDGESTQDMVFSGHNLIAENGSLLAESKLFENGITISEIDFKRLAFERRKISTYPAAVTSWGAPAENYQPYFLDNLPTEFISLDMADTALTRGYSKTPFIPADRAERNERCHLILQMQSHGLMKRIAHTHAESVVIGISGGLDSTLALLVCVMAMDLLKRPHTDIVAVTMPCFGTTKRTRSNAEILCEALGVTFREVNISKAVLQHFEDIGHDYDNHNVVFENGQARERTKVLMNIANQVNGLVIGTGDLSELALGWATYNGDHMSMYGVNGSIPKTLVKYLVEWVANHKVDDASRLTLLDIVDTPISPELIPADENGNIKQKTEDLVGPYELHDFFLYHFLRFGSHPSKIYFLAQKAFAGIYDNATVKKWLYTFFRRFFQQQFKRSCLPDGPKVGSVSLSPRGDWRMPSDAVSRLWLEEIERINI